VNPPGIMTKTVKTVLDLRQFEITPLKRGVNERLGISSVGDAPHRNVNRN